MKLEYISVPLWSPPEIGPWRIRWTRPNGESGLGVISYTYREDADRDSARCSKVCREGCTYDVLSDPGGSAWTYP